MIFENSPSAFFLKEEGIGTKTRLPNGVPFFSVKTMLFESNLGTRGLCTFLQPTM